MTRTGSGSGAGRIALVGVLAALSLVILWISAISPVGRLGVVALAGLIPAGAVISSGLGSGFLCYGAVGLLGLLLLPDKGNALLYLLFFGLYPMAKCLMEQLGKLPLEWLCKLIFCNGMITLFWFGLTALFIPFLPEQIDQTWLVYVAGNIAFIIYDIGFSKLVSFYVARIDKVLRKSR